MTSGGLGLSESLGQDISQEELDFSDLFLYNQPGDDFPVGCDKGTCVIVDAWSVAVVTRFIPLRAPSGPNATQLSGTDVPLTSRSRPFLGALSSSSSSSSSNGHVLSYYYMLLRGVEI